MSETTPPAGEEQQQEQTFTQADVDRMVGKARTDERRKANERFADYDELKKQAEGARTAEQRIADLEKRLTDADAREQRAQLVAKVAKDHKVTDPDDIALFLTASDEETLTLQAARLAGREEQQQRRGNYVPNEGNKTTSKGDSDMREFARRLFEQE